MVSDETARALWGWTLPELAGVAALFVLVAAGLFGDSSFLASASRPLRLALLGFLAVELAMPVVNVLGALAYLERRKRRRE